MFNFKQIYILQDDPIKKVVELLNESSVKVALVVDKEDLLLGTVTDGDVRRGLLKGESLESSVKTIMEMNYKYLKPDATKEQALNKMNKEDLRQIPVIDQKGCVVKLFLLDDLTKPQIYNNWVIIMAGGKGERLSPITKKYPKPMLKVRGRPMLEIILENCIKVGLKKFYISVNHLKEEIINYFGNGDRWGIEIHYLKEKKPLGTAGSLGLLPERPCETVLVINGDVLTHVNLNKMLQFHQKQKASATICVSEFLTKLPYGVVKIIDSKIISIEEKPEIKNFVNAGIYAFNPNILDLIPSNIYCDMPQLIEFAMKKKHLVVAFPIHEYWIDVGLPETLKKAAEDWN